MKMGNKHIYFVRYISLQRERERDTRWLSHSD